LRPTKTLDRLFDEIRREAKRNPDFADRLDAVLRLHESRREIDEAVIDGVSNGDGPPAATPKKHKPAPVVPSAPQPPEPEAAPVGPAPSLNPAGLFKRAGEDALTEALAALDLAALQALVAEHNLDPSGKTAAMEHDELAAHIVAQAKRRAERDEKMFDY
jgi:hypothetical protein